MVDVIVLPVMSVTPLFNLIVGINGIYTSCVSHHGKCFRFTSALKVVIGEGTLNPKSPGFHCAFELSQIKYCPDLGTVSTECTHIT